MADPVYSHADAVAPDLSPMGPVSLGPVAASPRAAAASSLVKSEQASAGAGALAAARRNPDADRVRAARMVERFAFPPKARMVPLGRRIGRPGKHAAVVGLAGLPPQRVHQPAHRAAEGE